MKRFALYVIAATVLTAGAARAQLNETEQRIVAAVKQQMPAALALLERSVRINSGTLNPEGVRAVGEVYRAELQALGLQTRWAEMPPAMKRAGHLIASREGGQGKRVLLMGHLDTVFEKDSPVAAWERRGNRVRGQGVSDMKGGNAILIEALRALRGVGALDKANIEVIFTGDEERTGAPLEIARAPLIELAKRADYALSFEGSGRASGVDSVSIARRSAGGWSLHVRGRPGHSAGVFSPQSGFGAIYEGARILNAFREQLIEPNLTYNVGVVLGGTNVAYSDETAEGTAFGKSNVIARDFQVRGDMRYLTPEQGERAKRRMREIVAANLPGTTATITFRESYPPMPPTEAGERLVSVYSRVSQDAGLGPIGIVDPASRGAGDVQFVAPYTTGIDGLGAAGSGSHTDDEDLEIASIERGAIRAALFIYRLTRP
jgi:glutamate carboxypeptidase